MIIVAASPRPTALLHKRKSKAKDRIKGKIKVINFWGIDTVTPYQVVGKLEDGKLSRKDLRRYLRDMRAEIRHLERRLATLRGEAVGRFAVQS
jgi:hypothetical protein